MNRSRLRRETINFTFLEEKNVIAPLLEEKIHNNRICVSKLAVLGSDVSGTHHLFKNIADLLYH